MKKATIAAIFGSSAQQTGIGRHRGRAMIKKGVGTPAWWRKRLEEAGTDLLREMVKRDEQEPGLRADERA